MLEMVEETTSAAPEDKIDIQDKFADDMRFDHDLTEKNEIGIQNQNSYTRII